MSMMFALPLEHSSCPGCHYEEEHSFEEGASVQWYLDPISGPYNPLLNFAAGNATSFTDMESNKQATVSTF